MPEATTPTPVQMNVKILQVNHTTAEWAAIDTVLDKGLLAVEYTTAGKTKIKVGDGVNKFADLAYVEAAVDLNTFYTKTEVDEAIEGAITDLGDIFTLKGVVASKAELDAITDAVAGDVYLVVSAVADAEKNDSYEEYVRTQSGTWEYLGVLQQDIDLSEYATLTITDALDERIQALEADTHTHANKAVLDAITAVDDALSAESSNPVKNSVINTAVEAIKGRLDDLEADTHTHDNKEVLDAITAVETTIEKDSANPVSGGAVYTAIDEINTTTAGLEENKVAKTDTLILTCTL